MFNWNGGLYTYIFSLTIASIFVKIKMVMLIIHHDFLNNNQQSKVQLPIVSVRHLYQLVSLEICLTQTIQIFQLITAYSATSFVTQSFLFFKFLKVKNLNTCFVYSIKSNNFLVQFKYIKLNQK